MSRREKLFGRILSGDSDYDIGFEELCNLLVALGFEFWVNGSHHIFYRTGVEEILNIQPTGHRAKAYQVRQVRQILLRHGLRF